MRNITQRLEDVLRHGTDNEVWDTRLMDIYERVETLMSNCPEWHVLSEARQDYLILLAIVGVEEVDNNCLH